MIVSDNLFNYGWLKIFNILEQLINYCNLFISMKHLTIKKFNHLLIVLHQTRYTKNGYEQNLD